jgi:two-component system cell cycle response regulator
MSSPTTTSRSDDLQAEVLIVDDNEQNLELLQIYMQEIGSGIHTRLARNGLEALEAVGQGLPDLILLDVMMPRMSGYEVCRQLKGNATTRDIPVIIITALNESSDFERAMESGADDFLTQPLNRVEFITRIRSLLRIKQLRREFPRSRDSSTAVES